MISYISTRGSGEALDFEAAVLSGLAPDGGLYVPDALPRYSREQLMQWANLDYPGLALEIMHPLCGNALSREELKAIIDKAYSSFAHAAIAPLKQLSSNHFLLELFHGPTLAFKDFALQFLGHLLDHILKKRGQKVLILGATSGDTGSAAIAGCRGRNNIQIVILHPHNRTSAVQRRQMTTVEDNNVHNIALEGTFDDCQDIVKQLFLDEEFRKRHTLVAVNSINWARIMAQTVYYFYAAFRLGSPARAVSFSVPTGNFGDIYAGYLAASMGLPIEKLIIATNKNDILARCLQAGAYSMQSVVPTLSPSMDIQISSNFERLLFDLYQRDGKRLAQAMQDFRATKSLVLPEQAHATLKRLFTARALSDEETLAAIKRIYEHTGELLDPHTAVGVAAAETFLAETTSSMVTLATAHPAKFPEAVERATGVHPKLPKHMEDLFEKTERFSVLKNDIDIIKQHINLNAR